MLPHTAVDVPQCVNISQWVVAENNSVEMHLLAWQLQHNPL